MEDTDVLEMLLIEFTGAEWPSSALLQLLAVVGTVTFVPVGVSETCITLLAFGATVRGGGV